MNGINGIPRKPSAYLATAAVVLAFLFILWIQHPIRLIIQNDSSRSYESIHLTVGRQIVDFGTLRPGERKEKWFLYEGSDSSFRLKTTSEDKEIAHPAGCITSGPGLETVYFELREDDEIYFAHKH